MSFSNTPKFRKLLCAALVLVMITTLFTGCFGSSEPEDDTSEPGLNINLSNTTAAPTETEPEVPETTAPEINENTAVVTSSKNVRSSPSTEATVITTLYAGDRVEISRRQTLLNAEWAYIISPVSGWIDMEFVEMDIPTADTPSNDTSTPAGNGEVTAPTTDSSSSNSSTSSSTTEIKAVVNANGLYIRSEASKDGKVQGSYAKGDVITILETKNGWGRTNKGWVSMDYVTTTGNTSSSSSSNTTSSSTNSGSTTVTGNGSTTVQLKGVVKVNELNIRASGTTDAEKVGSYSYGTRVEILEKSGSWGRTNKGWIHLDYIYQDCTTGGPNAVSNATITGSGLNIRSGPGTNYDAVGSYNSGDIVNILAQFTFDGTTWGCTNKGWISMKYVDTGASSSSTDSNTSSTTGTTATVTADALRIRSAAGSSYTVVGSLSKGDTVTILAQQTVDGTTWGQIALGWICMDYVEVN